MDEWRKYYSLLTPEQRRFMKELGENLEKEAKHEFMHKWRQTLPVLLFPALMSLFAVIDPETAGRVIEDLWGVFSIILLLGIILAMYQGVRLHRRFSLLMACSLILAIVMLVPFIFLVDVTTSWMAVIVIYNISLAFYLVVTMGIYLVMMGINPPRGPYV